MISTSQVTERVNRFPTRCKGAGLKVTHQRTAVYNMLANTDSHPTPEEVYSQIRKDLPTISLATVYKILDLFHRYGFLRKVSTEGQVARYDANTDHHNHAICTECGHILDIMPELAEASRPEMPPVKGFSVTHYDVIYHGVCNDCGGRA